VREGVVSTTRQLGTRAAGDSVIDAVVNIWAEEGIIGFWKGGVVSFGTHILDKFIRRKVREFRNDDQKFTVETLLKITSTDRGLLPRVTSRN
jgi:hypothetical protein